MYLSLRFCINCIISKKCVFFCSLLSEFSLRRLRYFEQFITLYPFDKSEYALVRAWSSIMTKAYQEQISNIIDKKHEQNTQPYRGCLNSRNPKKFVIKN